MTPRGASQSLATNTLTSLAALNPVVIYLATRSVLAALSLPVVATIILEYATRRASSMLVRAYCVNFVVFLGLLVHAELLFVYGFPDYVIENLYKIERGYYFNRPRLAERFVDKEYAVDYRTNHQGIRISTRHDPERTISDVDWVFLGDSYTQGAQVDFEQLYTSRLYAHFPDRIILNLGVSGLGIGEEYQLYATWAARTFHPRKVFLQVCSFNDFMNVAPQRAGITEHVASASALARFLLQRWVYQNPAELPLGRWTEPFYPEDVSNREYNVFYTPTSPKKENDLALFGSYLEKLRDAVQADGAELIVFLLPTKEQVDPVAFAETTTAFSIDPEKLDMRRPNRMLAELARELGVDFLDLLSVFEETGGVYYEYDEHLTSRGHQVLADALAEHLRERGLQPPTLLSPEPSGDRYPMYSRDGSLVTFQSERDGNYELFLTDAQFSEIRRLTFNDVDEGHAMLTRDGSRILFTEGNSESLETHVTIMHLDGSGRRRVVPEQGVFSAIGVFSPDDTMLSFAQWRRSGAAYTHAQIALLDLLRGTRRLLTSPTYESWRPAFSPDGQTVVYISRRNEQYDLFLQDLDSGEETQLTATPFDEWDPAFAPDGTQLVYAARPDGNWDLYQYDLATQRSLQLTRTRGDEWDPTFAPDGTLVYAGTYGFFAGILKE